MVDKASSQVRRMFASVAPRYDLLNRLLSLSVDQYWRRVSQKKLLAELPEHPLVLDLCTGTGDLALGLAGQGRVIGCDFCRPMLDLAAVKIARNGLGHRVSLLEGDALSLPFPKASFDGVTIAFGLRNLEDLREGLAEMFRVLKPGGRLGILEFSIPSFPLVRPLYLWYFTLVLPLVGRWVSGRDGPYSYLPDSVREFPESGQLLELMTKLGFQRTRGHALTFGIATLYLAVRP